MRERAAWIQLRNLPMSRAPTSQGQCKAASHRTAGRGSRPTAASLISACGCFRGRGFVDGMRPSSSMLRSNLHGLIPTVVHMTEGKRADLTWLDDLVIEPRAIEEREK